MIEIQPAVLATIAIVYFASLLGSYLFLAYCNYVYEDKFKLKRGELITILTPMNFLIFVFGVLVLAVTSWNWLVDAKVPKAGPPEFKRPDLIRKEPGHD